MPIRCPIAACLACLAVLAAAGVARAGAEEDKAMAARIVGKWTRTTPRGPMTQEYKADGTCTSQGTSGNTTWSDTATWKVERETLIVKLTGTGENTLQRFEIVRVDDKEFVLRNPGGNDVTLTRVK